MDLQLDVTQDRADGLLGHPVLDQLCHISERLTVLIAAPGMTRSTFEGYWFDRTRESAARRRGETFGKYEYATAETVELAPLPCWSHLPVEEQRRRVASLICSIDEQAAARRQASGIRPQGVAAVLAQNPLHRPGKIKKSPAPFVHAATKEMRQLLWEGYALFVAAYRTAAEKLKAGDSAPPFPVGASLRLCLL